MKIHPHVACPVCHGAMAPIKVQCPECHISVTGHFAMNEFAGLGEEDLHFLRIFVLCEGRIRDMESALGVSYPTIKARLAHLKSTLAAGRQEQSPAAAASDPPALSPAAQVLQELHAGRMSYAQAMERLKALPKESP